MYNNRRRFLIGATALAFSYGISSPFALAREKKKTRLILLGTRGGPRVDDKGRKNASTLLVINNIPYVVDCGYGTTRQLVEAGVSLDMLRYFFITHHHSDHNLEYGGVIYNGWAGGLRTRIDAYGPPGLQKMTEDFFAYMKVDIDTRIEDEGRPDLRKLVFPHEFDKSGIVLENDDVRVSTCRVLHPLVDHAYAYRFDAEDRSIVISGDTTYSQELAKFATGADVLVHEVMYMPGLEALLKRVPNAARLRTHLLASHTVPEDVGKVAAQAGVKTLVLSHFVPGDDPGITDDQWAEGVRKHFDGRIIVGKDLMEIEG